MHAKVEGRQTLLLLSVKTVQSGCYIKSLATALHCMRSCQFAQKSLVLAFAKEEPLFCFVLFFLSTFEQGQQRLMNVLLLEVPWPGAREQNSTTLSHLHSCSSFKEGGCCQGCTDICGVSGEGQLWESTSQWVDGSPCWEGASGSLHCAVHSVANTKLPSLFFRQFYSFFSIHMSCLSGSYFNKSSKEHIYSRWKSFPTGSFLNSSLVSVKRRH